MRPALLVLCFCYLALPATAHAAAGDERVRLYRTPAEQREVGLSRQITSWLRGSGLFEAEWSRDRLSGPALPTEVVETDKSATVQIGLVAMPYEAAEVELVLEYDTKNDRIATDEFIASLEWDRWELIIGRQNTPFGEYFSGFSTGPLIEFGETIDGSASLSYEITPNLDGQLTVYEGVAGARSRSQPGLDWVAALQGKLSRNLWFGLSYQSDLADSEDRLLEETGNRYARKVSAASGYLLWSADNYEFTVEAVTATRGFEELPADRDTPAAWNLELATFVHPRVDMSFRIEGSRELEGAPKIQYGVAATYLLHANATLTTEVLYGRFRDGFATDDDDNTVDSVTRINALLSIAF